MDSRKRIESLMYSYDDWKTVGNKKYPYRFEIQKENQYLYYFGANHSYDFKNEQYSELRKYWRNFLKKTGGNNIIVLVEGGIRRVAESEESAIYKDSEAGFITFLAHQANIFTDSPEPERYMERQELLKGFSKEEVQYYYFARAVHQWNNFPNPKPDFNKYINRFLKIDERDSRWKDFKFSLENMKRIHKNLFNTDFDENDKDFFSSFVNPTKEKSVINKVARACSVFRNVHIVLKIEKFWKQGKNIFAVFGTAHSILQEPALRELL